MENTFAQQQPDVPEPSSTEPTPMPFSLAESAEEKNRAGYIVEGIIQTGLNVLIGQPMTMKSALASALACRIAEGSKFLDRTCLQGNILAIDLQHEIQHVRQALPDRMKDLAGEKTIRIYDRSLEAKKILKALKDWHSLAPQLKFVVLDDWGRLSSSSQQSNAEVLRGIQTWALENEIGVLVPWRSSRLSASDPFSFISRIESLGIYPEHALALQRDELGLVLYSGEHSRQVIGLSADGQFREVENPNQRRLSSQKIEVLDVISHSSEPIGPSDIAALLGKPRNNIDQILYKLVREGFVTRDKGKYKILDPEWRSSPELK